MLNKLMIFICKVEYGDEYDALGRNLSNGFLSILYWQK